MLLGTNKVRVVGMSVMINYRDQLNLICLILKSSFFSNYEVFDIDYVRMSLETIGVKEVKNAREDGNCIKTSLIEVKWVDEISMVGIYSQFIRTKYNYVYFTTTDLLYPLHCHNLSLYYCFVPYLIHCLHRPYFLQLRT